MGAQQPDFFVIGAPKSGTTSLNYYLGQHPDIFMPARKDLPFFGTDLQIRYTYQYGRDRESLEQYLSFFVDTEGARRAGETAVWYLFSEKAAEEIYDFCPQASIIVILRNPVDMIYAQHSQFLSNLNEDIEDFAAALTAENSRRSGRQIPARAHFPQGLLYRDTAKYAVQLERYFNLFGRDRVQVIYYDDFHENTEREVRRVFEFLEVDPHVPLSTEIMNPNKVVRHRRLHSLAMARSGRLESIYHSLTPESLHGRLAGLVRRASLKYEPRPPMDAGLRQTLLQEMTPEILSLGQLLNRDLSPWLFTQPSQADGRDFS